MDSRIQVLAQIIADQCEEMMGKMSKSRRDSDVALLSIKDQDRYNTYRKIQYECTHIKFLLNDYINRNEEDYK